MKDYNWDRLTWTKVSCFCRVFGLMRLEDMLSQVGKRVWPLTREEVDLRFKCVIPFLKLIINRVIHQSPLVKCISNVSKVTHLFCSCHNCSGNLSLEVIENRESNLFMDAKPGNHTWALSIVFTSNNIRWIYGNFTFALVSNSKRFDIQILS